MYTLENYIPFILHIKDLKYLVTRVGVENTFFVKEVIQPQVPLRLPCYDFTPVISPTFGVLLHKGWSNDFGHGQLPWCDGRCVQGPGTYSPQYADLRLLAIPTSRRRVAAYDLN